MPPDTIVELEECPSGRGQFLPNVWTNASHMLGCGLNDTNDEVRKGRHERRGRDC
jgi:hypothetical protein